MAKTKSKDLHLGYWKIFVYMFIGSILFGPFLSLPTGIQNISVYGTDVIALLICLGWIFYIPILKKAVISSQLVKTFIIFLGIGLVSVLLSPIQLTVSEKIISLLYLLRLAGYGSVTGAVFVLVSYEKIRPGLVKSFLVGVGICAAIAGWLQYILYDDLRNLYYMGWDPHYKRIYSFFFDPNYFGLILVLSFILVLFRFKKSVHSVLGAFFLFLTIAFTYSRSSFVSLVVSSIAYSLMKKHFRIVLSVVLLLIISVFLLPRPGGEGVRLERVISIYERIDSYKLALQMFSDHPILGVGFNTVRFAKRVYGIPWENLANSHSGAGFDNSLLFVLATTGIVGMSAFLYLLCLLLKTGDHLFRISLLSVLVHSFFLNSLFYPWVLAWLGIIFCLKELKGNTKGGS